MSLRKRPAGHVAPPADEPGEPTEEPPLKKPFNPEWWKGSRGRKDLEKAVRHRQQKQDELWVTEIEKNPFLGQLPTLAEDAPAHVFRVHASRPELSRCLLFLLQSMLLIIRCWKLSPETEQTWGLGKKTTARWALLFHHELEMGQDSYSLMASMERHLFARVKKEGDNMIAMRQAVEAEWTNDRKIGVERRLKSVLETTVKDAILDGRLPRINFKSLVPVERQYDDCWKE